MLILDFGKYKGKEIGDVPASYLLWFYEQPWCKKSKPKIYNYIKRHKKDLEMDSLIEEENCPWLADLYAELHWGH